jgi:hypothetical protein
MPMFRLPMLALAVSFVLAAGSAQAVTITFSDYAGSESGNSASISQDGYDLDITANPTDYDLTIGSEGLGVACSGSYWACYGNDPNEIDASHGESIHIDFGEIVGLHDVELLNLYDGLFLPDEEAQVGAGGVVVTVDGEDLFFGAGDVTVDFGGIATSYVSFTAVGPYYSDFSVKSLTLGRVGAGGPAGASGPAVPEPGAALVFAVGLAVVGRRARRG